ncbi:nucleoside hydrolase [Thalassospira sp. MCCC 1A01428]|uniref:nucleoside hydrolase n=1 Tax=Thalassospira sp. MCCC 1A01428 TaxID=1470575 RepID=UPI000A1DD89D|nr:nucleoside hydrolase [Thalassospira sp. MCCC 1A01428]OSQ40015.1 nucleoside hydrolase [Thalassospira sp. MCCC 1A01428]
MAIWIDTDMGFDDIAAVLCVTHAGLKIDGMSLVAGNCPLPQVCSNAAAAASLFNWQFPIHAGRACPVLGRLETAERIMGPTGMLTAGQSLPSATLKPDIPAFDALCNWLQAPTAPGDERHILALGPLGNIAALILARPELAAKIDRITWMGGAVSLGNHTPSAEYNAFADPEALSIVLAHNVPLRMVDLDLCRQVIATPQDVVAIRKARGKNAPLLADLIQGYINIGLSRGRQGMAIFDPCAAIAVTNDDVITFAPARIDIDLNTGPSRGRTIVDPRPAAIKNAEYAVGVDAVTAREMIFAALQAEAEKE